MFDCGCKGIFDSLSFPYARCQLVHVVSEVNTSCPTTSEAPNISSVQHNHPVCSAAGGLGCWEIWQVSESSQSRK